jgi:hypothetical protein
VEAGRTTAISSSPSPSRGRARVIQIRPLPAYICLARRRPIYFEGDPLVLGGDRLPPPGKQTLPPLGAPQIGRSRQRGLPGAEAFTVTRAAAGA